MTDEEVSAEPIAVGQMWSVKGSQTRVVIGRIEPWEDGRIAVCVSIMGARIGPNAVASFAAVPFERSALVASLDRLLVTGIQSVDFEAAYQKWSRSTDWRLIAVGVDESIASGRPLGTSPAND